MKSLLLHFEDDTFEMMKRAKDEMDASWDTVVECAIAELYYQRVLKGKGEFERIPKSEAP